MLARMLLTLSVASFVGAAASVESLAVFVDSEANAGNAFTTGTVAISDAPDAAFLTVANLAPGDSSVAGLTISNDGSLALRYAMTSVATNDDAKGLRDELVLTVRDEGSGCGTFDGAVLYTGARRSSAGGAGGRPGAGGGSGRGAVLPHRAADRLGERVPGRGDERDVHVQR